jgi:tetratricopeptide (TPR) repeat protein
MKTIDFSYFIERYIADEMDDTEKIWFLKEVEGNDKLRQEIDLRRKTEAILKNRDVMNLREKLNTIENTRKAKEKAPVSGHSAVKYAAFIFGILIIAGSLTLITGRKISSDEIIDRYYKPYDPPASSRSASGTFNTDYTLAVEYYKIHDFRNAAVYFSKVINDEPGNMPSNLMKGISDFEIQNYPEATNSFRKVIDNNNNLYIDHAQWYLALCYIRTGEEQKAKEQLLEVEKSGSIYKNDAKKILRRIK